MKHFIKTVILERMVLEMEIHKKKQKDLSIEGKCCN